MREIDLVADLGDPRDLFGLLGRPVRPAGRLALAEAC